MSSKKSSARIAEFNEHHANKTIKYAKISTLTLSEDESSVIIEFLESGVQPLCIPKLMLSPLPAPGDYYIPNGVAPYNAIGPSYGNPSVVFMTASRMDEYLAQL